MFVIKDRLRAAGLHLGLSLLVAALTAALVLGLWFPYPYGDISGGRELFIRLVVIGLALGPLATFCASGSGKPWSVLRRDLAIIGALQVAGLAYGLVALSAARPVHLVFDHDRFVVAHAVEVPAERLDQAPFALQALPLLGPTAAAIRPFTSDAERVEAAMMEMQGLAAAARPELWMPYANARERVLAAAHPVMLLRSRFPQQTDLIDAALARGNLDASTALYLPMRSKQSYWTVILDSRNGRPAGYLPIDSF